MNLGRLGIWTAQLDFAPAPEVREAVQVLEQLGYGAVWVGENVGREPIAQAGLLLGATDRIVVATGVMNIWARDALATRAAQLTLAEAYPDRFLLGIGTSHARLVTGERGHTYDTPLAAMVRYLDAMDQFAERYRAVKPENAPLVLAALGPRMLRLAAKRADGAHTYFVPPEHTARARAVLGDGRLLAVEQAFVLATDPTEARGVARRHVRRYLPLINYTDNLRRLGFEDDDFEGDGSDRLVDAIVARGDVDAVARRIDEHWAAGADHVCLQALGSDSRGLPIDEWKELAQLLPGRRSA